MIYKSGVVCSCTQIELTHSTLRIPHSCVHSFSFSSFHLFSFFLKHQWNHTIYIHTHTLTALRWENEILQFHPPNFVFFIAVLIQASWFIHELCFYQNLLIKKNKFQNYLNFLLIFSIVLVWHCQIIHSLFKLISLLLSMFTAFSVLSEKQLDPSSLHHSPKNCIFTAYDDTIFQAKWKFSCSPILSLFSGTNLHFSDRKSLVDDISHIPELKRNDNATNLSKQFFDDHFSAILVTPQLFLSFGSPRIFLPPQKSPIVERNFKF